MKDNEIDLDSLSTTDHGYTVVDEDDDDDDPVLLDRNGDPVEAAPQPPRRARGGTREAHRNREGAVVLPAVRHPPADRGRNGAVRPVLVQPCRRREGDGVLHARGARRVHEASAAFEQMLVSSGIHLTKFWFSVSPAEQRTRFGIRLVDPLRQWKFSPMDMESVDNWDAYTAAKEEMFAATDTDFAPWIVVKSNDKKRARINAMRHLLWKFDYDDKDHDVATEPDPQIVGRALED